jgi:F-box associated protein
MQSDPTKASQNASNLKSTENDQSSTIQHGIHHTSTSPQSGSASEVRSQPLHVVPFDDITDESSLDEAEVGTAVLSRSFSQSPNSTESHVKLARTPGVNNVLDISSTETRNFTCSNTDGVPIKELPTGSFTRLVCLSHANASKEILVHTFSHLDPATVSSVSLVCKLFYNLVTAPDAWRSAFARYFPGSSVLREKRPKDESVRERIRSSRRLFTRLTAEGRWRDEYVFRGHLLRSLEKGRPLLSKSPSKSSRGDHTQPIGAITLNEGSLKTAITNIDVSFETEGLGNGYNIIMGSWYTGEPRLTDSNVAAEVALGDQRLGQFRHFSNLFPTDLMYGLGSGRLIGCENRMDVSRSYGTILGGGYPGGLIWLRGLTAYTDFLLRPCDTAIRHFLQEHRTLGIPDMMSSRESVTAVWIAKSDAVPSLSEGMVGVLTGTSLGIVSAYSLGMQGMRDRHIKMGELTARWVLSPGVPIIALAIDNEHSLKRQAQNRIWAIALNALGEVFYLTKFPKRSRLDFPSQVTAEANAWLAGRTVYWNLVEPTRRAARMNYDDDTADNAYSPRSSWNGMCLSENQIKGETIELERYFAETPADFRQMCHGWDMQRLLQVDFAGDDENFAGEAVVVATSGYGDGTSAEARRYVRCKVGDDRAQRSASTSGHSTPRPAESSQMSIFGPPADLSSPAPASDLTSSSIHRGFETSSEHPGPQEEWRTSVLAASNMLPVHYTIATLDCSRYALTTTSEDSFFAPDEDSSDSGSSNGGTMLPDVSLMPGQRARFFALGTDTGAIYIWDVRRSIPRSNLPASPVLPVREIYTESPAITSLALTSLYLVHGGSDGLVQAWDPLASRTDPIRTISGRPTGRFRRAILRSQATAISNRGFPTQVGYNQFAAGTIALDSDPTSLRGIVTIGSLVRAWSFRSNNIERRLMPRAGRTKRRLRRTSDRNPGLASNRHVSGPVAHAHHIRRELADMKREQKALDAKKKHLEKRFGVGTLGEQEALELAMLLSSESFEVESSKNTSVVATPSRAMSAVDMSSVPVEGTASSAAAVPGTALNEDDELAEAIRRSLQDVKASDSPSSSPPALGRSWSQVASSATVAAEREDTELEMALKLSLLEQGGGEVHSDEDRDAAGVEYPQLPGVAGAVRAAGEKSKGKSKSVW